ncbi:MAG: hypothetical protein ABSH35_26410 [Isosphaeraceae bacterium]|jgi:hypothetical protein
MSHDPPTSIEDKSVSASINFRFIGPVPQALPTSFEDLIEAFVEGTVDFQFANDKDPFALFLRAMVELIRVVLGRAIKAIDTRGDVRWPQHPEVLARAWKEALGLHDWARAHLPDSSGL